MSLGSRLLTLRKKSGISKEDVASKINVSTKTLSKWETNQSIPEVNKAKLLSNLYNVSYEYLVSGTNIDSDFTSIETLVEEIDWTSAWSKKYPILDTYQGIEGINDYYNKIAELYDTFKIQFDFDDTDTVLVLKDILYKKYKNSKKK